MAALGQARAEESLALMTMELDFRSDWLKKADRASVLLFLSERLPSLQIGELKLRNVELLDLEDATVEDSLLPPSSQE